MFRFIATLVMAFGLSAMPVLADDTLPHPFGSAEVAIAYGIKQGCLTWMREGGRLKDYVQKQSRTVTQKQYALPGQGEPTQKAEKIYGDGRVTIQEASTGGCYIRAERGDGASYRDTALKTLRDMGYTLEPFDDYEPYVKSRDWSYLQESWCWRDGEKVMIILISSSANRSKTPLQASILVDREDTAAKKGLCLPA